MAAVVAGGCTRESASSSVRCGALPEGTRAARCSQGSVRSDLRRYNARMKKEIIDYGEYRNQ